MTSYHYSQILSAPNRQMKAQILQHRRDLLLVENKTPYVHTYIQLSELSSCWLKGVHHSEQCKGMHPSQFWRFGWGRGFLHWLAVFLKPKQTPSFYSWYPKARPSSSMWSNGINEGCKIITFLTLLLLLLEHNFFAVLATPSDSWLGGTLGLANKGGIVVFPDTYSWWWALCINDVGWNYGF